MKLLSIFIFLVLSFSIKAQYYYSDILSLQQSDKQYELLLKNTIKTVTAKSFNADGSETEGFFLQQNINASIGEIKTTSTLAAEGQSVSVSHYKNNRIIQTSLSAENVSTEVSYEYDADYNIIKISTISVDTFMNTKSEEIHQWVYASGKPLRMLLIKNNTDTTIVELKQDEKGNISSETWRRKGYVTERYYYYYNDQLQLTDIVRFNLKAQRMLPDYVFQYDSKRQLISTIQVPQGSDDYLTWNYFYNATGLKVKELCFNKQKLLLGSIEYEYK